VLFWQEQLLLELGRIYSHQTEKRKDMGDNLNDRGPADRSRIDVTEEWELRYWSKKFSCTPEQLKEAVKAAGVSVESVRKHLGK
jgi:hypothetical protein